MEPVLGQLIMILIVLAGAGMVLGGGKTAKKILLVPIKFAGNLALDAVHGIIRFSLDLLGQGLRGFGRLLDRGLRRLFRLPPPQPARRQLRQPQQNADDDED